jgi:lipid-binding SYLF domain-containing protein
MKMSHVHCRVRDLQAAKGVFAGVSLGGSTVEPDNDANFRLYGKTLTANRYRARDQRQAID